MLLGQLLLALLLTLFLRLLLRTSTLVQRVEVYLAHHVQIGHGLLLSLQFVDLRLWGYRLGGRLLGGFLHTLRLSGLLSLRCFGRYRSLGLLRLCLRLFLHRLGLFGHGWLLLCLLLRSRFSLLLWLWLCGLGFLLLFRLLGGLLRGLPHTCQVYLSQRLESLARFFLHLYDGGGRFLPLLRLILLLREHHTCLGLHILVTLELLDECFILLVRNLRVDIGVVLNLTQTRLVLQIFDSRLKTYIQFF